MFEEELALRILVERLKRRRYRRVKGLAKKYHVSPPSTASTSLVDLTRDDQEIVIDTASERYLSLSSYPIDRF